MNRHSKIWCLVSLPNSQVFEVELDPKALGEDCLKQACSHLGILETDFFGLLQVNSGVKETGYWLNVRNVLSRQLAGSQPYRLQLRVKFFVPPHDMLQHQTRAIVLQSVKESLMNSQLSCNDQELVTFCGLIAQAELGDFKKITCPGYKEVYSKYIPEGKDNENIIKSVILEHKKHKSLSNERAVYRALQVASEWDSYGMEWHTARKAHTSDLVSIGVGPRSIVMVNSQLTEYETIDYEHVQKATHAGKCFYLHTLDQEGTSTTETFKLPNQRASNALYRCVTEMYLFYYCDTIRNDVASQFDRDFKATLAALFSENKDIGKKYVFDTQRTLRETLDYNRRRLYSVHVNNSAASSLDTESDEDSSDIEEGTLVECNDLSELMLCQVCMDGSLGVAFDPCGHVCCCTECARQVNSCPICRQNIQGRLHIYLPTLPACNKTTETQEKMILQEE